MDKGGKKMWSLDALLTGSVAGAVVAAVLELFHILLNKKVRTPADLAAQRRADIVERNEMITEQRNNTNALRDDMKEMRGEINALRAENKQQEEQIDGLREEAMARDHYIYRCLGTFHRLGISNEIPQPVPFVLKRPTKETE